VNGGEFPQTSRPPETLHGFLSFRSRSIRLIQPRQQIPHIRHLPLTTPAGPNAALVQFRGEGAEAVWLAARMLARTRMKVSAKLWAFRMTVVRSYWSLSFERRQVIRIAQLLPAPLPLPMNLVSVLIEVMLKVASRSSCYSFDEWTETFGTERLTGALLDRLTHHVNILEMNGESYRLAQSQARKATKTS
jgi:hypothetical protein